MPMPTSYVTDHEALDLIAGIYGRGTDDFTLTEIATVLRAAGRDVPAPVDNRPEEQPGLADRLRNARPPTGGLRDRWRIG